MNITVYIERLIVHADELDGLHISHSHRQKLQAAIEAELARQLAEGGLAPAMLMGGAWPAVSAGSMQLTNDGKPEALGQQIAQAVYGGIGGGEK